MADSLFWSWLFSFWQEATTPVGRWVMRTAESVVLTDWPPGPEERYTSIRRSLGLISTSTSSASGVTSTPAAEVWMRPCDSVAGHALHAVHPALVLQPGPDALAGLGRRPLVFTATWTSL